MRLLISMLLGVSLSAAIMAPAFSEPPRAGILREVHLRP